MHCAIPNAKRDSKALDQSAGSIVRQISVTMEHSALSPNHMVEEQDHFINVKMATVRNGVCSGILNVKKASTMWHAASAHLIALRT